MPIPATTTYIAHSPSTRSSATRNPPPHHCTQLPADPQQPPLHMTAPALLSDRASRCPNVPSQPISAHLSPFPPIPSQFHPMSTCSDSHMQTHSLISSPYPSLASPAPPNTPAHRRACPAQRLHRPPPTLLFSHPLQPSSTAPPALPLHHAKQDSLKHATPNPPANLPQQPAVTMYH